MKRLLLPFLAAAALAHAADSAKPGWAPVDAALEPGKSVEHCDRLAEGEKRRFQWRSNASVDFNIHYHDATEAIYPLKRDGMRGDGGTFTAKTAQEYCWMWTARNVPARIQAQIETR